MDALSEILKSLKMRHTAIGTLQLSAPWGLRLERFDAPTAYGLAEGPGCWLRPKQGDPVLLEQGDIALFARGGYSISSAPNVACQDFGTAFRANRISYGSELEPDQDQESPISIVWGNGGPTTRLLGMAFGLASEQHNPLRDALPELIILRKRDHGTFPWIQPGLDFLSAPNAHSPGFAATTKLLSELIFISILRSHLLGEPHATRGWLRGLTDPAVARALLAIHAQPGSDLTVASLARIAGVSRTALATRFAALVEASPIEYLTHWRLHLAAERLFTSQPNLSRLAFELGYASDAAFREAFKRRYGVPPSRYAQHRESRDGDAHTVMRRSPGGDAR